MEELLDLKSRFSDAKIVFGNTEIGVEEKFRFLNYSVLINPRGLTELCYVKASDYGVFVGAGLTLNQMNDALKTYVDQLPGLHRLLKALISKFIFEEPIAIILMVNGECLKLRLFEIVEWKTQVLRETRRMIHWFAGKHVRNMAVSSSKF